MCVSWRGAVGAVRGSFPPPLAPLEPSLRPVGAGVHQGPWQDAHERADELVARQAVGPISGLVLNAAPAEGVHSRMTQVRLSGGPRQSGHSSSSWSPPVPSPCHCSQWVLLPACMRNWSCHLIQPLDGAGRRFWLLPGAAGFGSQPCGYALCSHAGVLTECCLSSTSAGTSTGNIASRLYLNCSFHSILMFWFIPCDIYSVSDAAVFQKIIQLPLTIAFNPCNNTEKAIYRLLLKITDTILFWRH